MHTVQPGLPDQQPHQLACGRFKIPLHRPLLMGILNVTPDSFSDGGKFFETQRAVERVAQMVADGADILDIGGESARPGAAPISEAEEISRISPAILAARDSNRPISVDTRHTEVMRVALELGADMINDIAGFQDPGAEELMASANCGLCVMHMLGEPGTMQNNPKYQDVVSEIIDFLMRRVDRLVAAGVQKNRIVLDPGIGFGKTHQHNLLVIEKLRQLVDCGFPVLMGISRKSLVGNITGRPVQDRLAGSLAAALACVERGAVIIRAHDVQATRDALDVWYAITSKTSA